MSLLVTAFAPFGDDSDNVSEDVLNLLSMQDSGGDRDVGTLLLPVEREAASNQLEAAVSDSQIDTVVCLGQANDRQEITIEKVAINFCCYRIPDNAGNQPTGEPIVADGPDAYFSTLPVQELVTALGAEGYPASISYSTGTYVCNSLFYGLMHFIAKQQLRIRAGFVHLPRTDRLDIQTQVEAVRLITNLLR